MKTAWLQMRCPVTQSLSRIQSVWHSDNIFINFEQHCSTLKNEADDSLFSGLRVKHLPDSSSSVLCFSFCSFSGGPSSSCPCLFLALSLSTSVLASCSCMFERRNEEISNNLKATAQNIYYNPINNPKYIWRFPN